MLYNCKIFHKRSCWNILCKPPVKLTKTKSEDGKKLVLKYKDYIDKRIKFLEIKNCAANIVKIIHDSNQISGDRNDDENDEKEKVIEDEIRNLEHEIESLSGNDKTDNRESKNNSKIVIGEEKERIVNEDVYENNKSNQMLDNETSILENEIESYCGDGKPEKNKSNKPKELNMKAAFTGICTVDSIINLFRCTAFFDNIIGHNLCNHKENCSTCILRSALCKSNVGKGVNKFVEVPEIKHNLRIFLGENHCPQCFVRFGTEEEKLIHLEGKKHEREKIQA